MQLLGKIPLRVRPLFWLVAALLGWMWTQTLVGTLLAMGIILISILVHELGHALIARCWQQEVRIEVAAFGGFTYRSGPSLRRWQEALVVIAGPLAGFLLAGGAYLAMQLLPISFWGVPILRFIWVINVFWTCMNLLPILPLDGGHLMSLLLESLLGSKGTLYAVTISCVSCIVLSLFFFLIGWLFAGALFVFLSFENVQGWRIVRRLRASDHDTQLQEKLVKIRKEVQRSPSASVMDQLEQLRREIGQGVLLFEATHLLLTLYRKEGCSEKAYPILIEMESELNPEERAWLHQLAFEHQEYALVLSLSSRCAENDSQGIIAMRAALSAAALKQVDAALGWLEAMLREGRIDLLRFLARSEWDAIRQHPKFLKWTANYARNLTNNKN